MINDGIGFGATFVSIGFLAVIVGAVFGPAIFGKRGETLAPARDLDPSQFNAIDMTQMTSIPLPDDGEYKIASRQDLSHLETPVDDDNKVAGTISITSPQEFWLPSKFLIIVKA